MRHTLLLIAALACQAADLTVVTSGAFRGPYQELAPTYRADRLTLAGTDTIDINNALRNDKPVDVVIADSATLADYARQGKLRPNSQVDLVRSKISIAVRAGAAHPDVSTLDALKQALLSARSIGFSASVSGNYLSSELFPQLGIAEQIQSKIKRISGHPVGEAIVSGEVELGFQQISELLAVKGLDVIGDLPASVQRNSTFSAAIPTASQHPVEAKALVDWLASPAAFDAIRHFGLVPLGH